MRLVNKKSGKPVPDAVIFAKRIDMAPDGMEMMVNGMKREGLSQADVDLMMKKNPARFLGLES